MSVRKLRLYAEAIFYTELYYHLNVEAYTMHCAHKDKVAIVDSFEEAAEKEVDYFYIIGRSDIIYRYMNLSVMVFYFALGKFKVEIRDIQGRLESFEDHPAVITENFISWHKMGLTHREYAPAMIINHLSGNCTGQWHYEGTHIPSRIINDFAHENDIDLWNQTSYDNMRLLERFKEGI